MKALRAVWEGAIVVLALPVMLAGWLLMLVVGGFFIYALTLALGAVFTLLTQGTDGFNQ